jgi:lipoprotein signal peptidase
MLTMRPGRVERPGAAGGERMRYFILAALVVFGDQCLKSWVSANLAVGGK